MIGKKVWYDMACKAHHPKLPYCPPFMWETRRVSSVTMSTLETFVCHIFGKPGLSSGNKAMYKLFQQHYASKKGLNLLAKIKGADSSQLPPCYSVPVQKVRRTNLIAGMWKHVILPDPSQMDHLEKGWILKDGHYIWFDLAAGENLNCFR